ncbi:hypothetical protein LWI29_032177 [Acer saccharum]|uniref:Uncharacterized protein n=1 Tax=Acer saccharum TaxID=4024 RepID=A0AA39VKK6_ACESA|nr:hypothetical protein LWI29_032177 [Acer saccharum]
MATAEVVDNLGSDSAPPNINVEELAQLSGKKIKDPSPREDPKVARRWKGKGMGPKSGEPHQDYPKRLEICKNRTIRMERGIIFEELSGTWVIKELNRLRWNTFATIQNPCNKALVHEFYTSKVLGILEDEGPVMVM